MYPVGPLPVGAFAETIRGSGLGRAPRATQSADIEDASTRKSPRVSSWSARTGGPGPRAPCDLRSRRDRGGGGAVPGYPAVRAVGAGPPRARRSRAVRVAIGRRSVGPPRRARAWRGRDEQARGRTLPADGRPARERDVSESERRPDPRPPGLSGVERSRRRRGDTHGAPPRSVRARGSTLHRRRVRPRPFVQGGRASGPCRPSPRVSRRPVEARREGAGREGPARSATPPLNSLPPLTTGPAAGRDAPAPEPRRRAGIHKALPQDSHRAWASHRTGGTRGPCSARGHPPTSWGARGDRSPSQHRAGDESVSDPPPSVREGEGKVGPRATMVRVQSIKTSENVLSTSSQEKLKGENKPAGVGVGKRK